MTTMRTITASNPVAAWTSSPEPPSCPRTQTATNHVTIVAPSETPAPTATGLRIAAFAPRRPASTAARTRIASSPSRSTRIAESNTTVPWLSEPVGASAGLATPPVAVAAR